MANKQGTVFANKSRIEGRLGSFDRVQWGLKTLHTNDPEDLLKGCFTSNDPF